MNGRPVLLRHLPTRRVAAGLLAAVAMIGAPVQAADVSDLLNAVRVLKEQVKRGNVLPPERPASGTAPEPAGPAAAPPSPGPRAGRELRLVTSVPAGGVARTLSGPLRAALGADVAVGEPEGRNPPAPGLVVLRAPADGGTLLFDDLRIAWPFAADGLLRGHARDLQYIGLVAEEPLVLMARPGFAPRDFDELRAWLRTHPGQVRFVVDEHRSGLARLCARLLAVELQAEVATVEVVNVSEAPTLFAAGGADLLCSPALRWMGMIERGDLRALAVGARLRPAHPALAGVPTFERLGLRGMPQGNGYGLFAPPATPPAALAPVAAALTRLAREKTWIGGVWPGLTPADEDLANPAAHRRFVEEQVARWAVGLDPATAPGAAAPRGP